MLTDAFVLKTWPYSESTLIVSLLTRHEGAVRVMAKGGRRLKGRTAAALDLFAQVRVSLRLSSRDGLGTLGSIELKNSWLYLRRDLRRLAFASLGFEILGAAASLSHHEPYFFEEAESFLSRLESSSGPGSLTACLLLRMLHHAGHPPRLDDALRGDRLPDRLAYDFDAGAIMEQKGESLTLRGGMPLSRALVETISDGLDAPPALDDSFLIPASHGGALLQWLIRIWEDHLNQKLQSARFLEKIVLKA